MQPVLPTYLHSFKRSLLRAFLVFCGYRIGSAAETLSEAISEGFWQNAVGVLRKVTYRG